MINKVNTLNSLLFLQPNTKMIPFKLHIVRLIPIRSLTNFYLLLAAKQSTEIYLLRIIYALVWEGSNSLLLQLQIVQIKSIPFFRRVQGAKIKN